MTSDTSTNSFFVQRLFQGLLKMLGWKKSEEVHDAELAEPDNPDQPTFITLEMETLRVMKSVGVRHQQVPLSSVILRFSLTGNEVDGFEACLDFQNRDQEDPDLDLGQDVKGLRLVTRRENEQAFSGTIVRYMNSNGTYGFYFDGPFFHQQYAKRR